MAAVFVIVNSNKLVIYGTRDRMIRYSMGKAVFERVEVSKQLITIDGGKHNDLQQYGAKYWQPIFEFVQSKGINKATYRQSSGVE